MASSHRRFGLSAALTMPFGEDGSPDLKRLTTHVQWCLSEGCDSVTAFGTTGEGASLGLPARKQVLQALIGSGIEARRSIAGGVASASVHDAVDQAVQLLDADCRAILMAPPFYFKGVSDEGLFAWFAKVFGALGDRARDVILYHIPSVTQVPLSLELIGRLRAAFPTVIVGVKDSGGDWSYTQKLLAAHGDLAILIGDERLLAQAVGMGAEGSISGLANLRPRELQAMVGERRADSRLVELVDEVLKYPVVPAVKALVAHRTGDAAWLIVRPPLVPLDARSAARLGSVYDGIFAAKAA